MKKFLKTFMTGALLIIPMAATIWVICWLGGMLGELGNELMVKTKLIDKLSPSFQQYAAVIGIALVVSIIYLIGLLANIWMFRWFFNLVDQTLSKLPGIKTIYESVRDLMKLFGGDNKSMGYVVLYNPPETNYKQLGIVTNEKPAGLPEGDDSVIVYLPMGYMIGGSIVFASPTDLERIDMSVETAMKLAATAFVGVKSEPNETNKLPQQETNAETPE